MGILKIDPWPNLDPEREWYH